MKYRDHINTGVIFIPCFYFLNAEGLGKLVPFIRYCTSCGIAHAFVLYICFFAGLSFPDIDVKHYGRQHRVRSPLHDIVNIGLFAVISAVAALCMNTNFALYCLNAFAYGCFFHLFGDFIQGGVGLRRKRIGVKSFTWSLYAETVWGTIFTVCLTFAAFAVSAFAYIHFPIKVSGPVITVFVGSFLFSSYKGALCFYIPAVLLALGNYFGILTAESVKLLINSAKTL